MEPMTLDILRDWVRYLLGDLGGGVVLKKGTQDKVCGSLLKLANSNGIELGDDWADFLSDVDIFVDAAGEVRVELK